MYFCKIIKGEIPCNKVLENDKFLAFHDINPVTKVHILVIPKNHVANIAHLTDEKQLMWKVFCHSSKK